MNYLLGGLSAVTSFTYLGPSVTSLFVAILGCYVVLVLVHASKVEEED